MIKVTERCIYEVNLIGSSDQGLETMCLSQEGEMIFIALGCLHEKRPRVGVNIRHLPGIVAFIKQVNPREFSEAIRSLASKEEGQ